MALNKNSPLDRDSTTHSSQFVYVSTKNHRNKEPSVSACCQPTNHDAAKAARLIYYRWIFWQMARHSTILRIKN
jgi:hypothetical protein